MEKKYAMDQNGNTVDIDILIGKMKKEDLRNLRLMRSFKWIYLGMAVIYVLMVVNPTYDILRRLAGVCYVLAFVLFSLVFRKLHKEYSEVDYSVALVNMLKKAVARYKLNLGRLLLVLPSVLLVDLGIVLSGSYGVDANSWNDVLIFQVAYFLALTISGFVGYLIWRKRQKPLHDSAKQMLEDLES